MSPVLFVAIFVIHASGLCKVALQTDWILWFVRDGYIYVSEHYGNGNDALYMIHEYDLLASLSLLLFVLYIALTMVVVVATRHYTRDVVYGTEIMRNIRHRSQLNNMKSVYRFLAIYAFVAIIAVTGVVLLHPEAGGRLLRLLAEHSLVTFVMVQSMMFPSALLLGERVVCDGSYCCREFCPAGRG